VKYHGVVPSAQGDTKYLYAPSEKEVIDAICFQKAGKMYSSPTPIVTGPELKHLNTNAILAEEEERGLHLGRDRVPGGRASLPLRRGEAE
jgi:hypothetical protein